MIKKVCRWQDRYIADIGLLNATIIYWKSSEYQRSSSMHFGNDHYLYPKFGSLDAQMRQCSACRRESIRSNTKSGVRVLAYLGSIIRFGSSSAVDMRLAFVTGSFAHRNRPQNLPIMHARSTVQLILKANPHSKYHIYVEVLLAPLCLRFQVLWKILVVHCWIRVCLTFHCSVLV